MISDNFIVILLALFLIYYLLKFTGHIYDWNNLFVQDEHPVPVTKTPFCNRSYIPREVIMANRMYSNFVPLNLHDDYGWGDPSFSSTGGGTNLNLYNDLDQLPFTEW